MLRRALLAMSSTLCLFACIGCKVPVVLAGFNDLTSGLVNTGLIVASVAIASEWTGVKAFLDQVLQTLPV